MKVKPVKLQKVCKFCQASGDDVHIYVQRDVQFLDDMMVFRVCERCGTCDGTYYHTKASEDHRISYSEPYFLS